MQVNFSTEEYEVLKYLADTQRKWPAALVHDWMMDMAYAVTAQLFKAQEERKGSREGSEDRSNSLPSSTPLEES